MIKKGLFSATILVGIMAMIFQMSGCVTAGWSIIDGLHNAASPIPDTIQVSIPEASTINAGSNVEVTLKSGAVFAGKFLGVRPYSGAEYSKSYMQFREKYSGEFLLPALGEKLTISTKPGSYLERIETSPGQEQTRTITTTQEQKFEAEFAGFDIGLLMTKPAERNRVQLRDLKESSEIRDEQGRLLDISKISKMLNPRWIPYMSRFDLQLQMTGAMKSWPLNEIAQITVLTKKASWWQRTWLAVVLDCSLFIIGWIGGIKI